MSHPVEERICVVGTGQAGLELALALRQQGSMAPVALIGEEPHLPYQRPPLSKAYLKGEVSAQSLLLRQQQVYDKAGVQLMPNTRVERIDREAKVLMLADGRQLGYSGLGLATGGRPRTLPLEEASRAERAANFHYLRTLDDVTKIRERFKAGNRLVVVGGGYIGLEVAAAAIASGLQVVVLEALPRVLARVTAPEMSVFYERVHREAGVDLRTNVQVTGLELSSSGDAVTAIKCNDGSALQADLVVVGIGLVPNTELAQAAGLLVDNGIVVDEYARTSDPSIVAAGDCTNHPSILYSRRVRLESVPNAIEQARTAAATLAGKQRVYDAVPWFWSDQYDLKLQMVGLSQGYDRVVVRGDMNGRSFSLFYLKEGVLIACDAVNRAQDFMAAKRLVACRLSLDPSVLADEGSALKELVPAA